MVLCITHITRRWVVSAASWPASPFCNKESDAQKGVTSKHSARVQTIYAYKGALQQGLWSAAGLTMPSGSLRESWRALNAISWEGSIHSHHILLGLSASMKMSTDTIKKAWSWNSGEPKEALTPEEQQMRRSIRPSLFRTRRSEGKCIKQTNISIGRKQWKWQCFAMEPAS